MRHPDFSIANPNRARSLIGAFCLGNPAASTAPTAPATRSGPTACSSSTPLNPQLASRIARALDRWTQLAEPYRQRGARGDRPRRRGARSSPTDVREIVSRALSAG